jgi:hypothetical protein
MTKVVVSCENKEELVSILSVLSSTLPRPDIYFFDTISLYSNHDIGLLGELNVVKCRRFFSGNFRSLGRCRKLIESLYISFQIFSLMRGLSAKVLVVGVSLVYHRVLKFILGGRLYIISFVRSTIVGQDDGRVRAVLRRFGFVGSVGDSYYCTGEITAKYLEKQSGGVINIIGPIDADQYPISSICPRSEKVSCLVLISSAFSWHGDDSGQYTQVEYFRSLASTALSAGIRVVILVHPRDDCGLYADIPNVEISAGGISKCIDIHNQVGGCAQFVSMASTLSFELAYLGMKSVLATDSFFYERNKPWYSSLGINPVIGAVSTDDSLEEGDLYPILYCKNRGNVISQASILLSEELKKYAR